MADRAPPFAAIPGVATPSSASRARDELRDARPASEEGPGGRGSNERDPVARVRGPAHDDRGRRGVLRELRLRVHELRQQLLVPRTTGGLRGDRDRRVAPDGADAVHGVAPPVGTARRRVRGASAPRAPPDGRLVRLRRGALDRAGTAHGAAVGVREARADRLHRRDLVAEGGQARRLAASRAAARSRRAARGGDRAAPARPGHDDRDRRERPDDAVRRRRAAPSPRCDGRRLDGRARVPHLRNGLPSSALPVVLRPVEGSVEPRVSAHPGVDRAGIRRVVRRGAGSQPPEVGVPAERPYRLHLRGAG